MRASLVLVGLLVGGCGGGSGNAATTPGAASVGAWGASVSAPAVEHRAGDVLAALARGDGASVASASLVIGPGLWGLIAESPDLAGLGIPISLRLKVAGEQVTVVGRAFRGDELPGVLDGETLQDLATDLEGAVVGPATEEERSVFYATIAWEIAGKPVTVARIPEETLVIELDSQGQLSMLEILSPLRLLLSGDRGVRREVTAEELTPTSAP